jgi:hypothetical protein
VQRIGQELALGFSKFTPHDRGMTITEPGPATVTALPVAFLGEVRVAFGTGVLAYETPTGMRLDAIATGGTVRGPRLDAEVLPGGGDWLELGPDGIARMDIRATLRTTDGAIVHYTSRGRTVLDDDARARYLAGEPVGPEGLFGRATPLFETAAEPYRWLNGAVAVGRVVELSQHHIHYQLFTLD